MVEFNTKLDLSTYINKDGAIEGKYCVLNDETMQNKKAFYSFVNGELVFESGGTTVINWRTTADTYAQLDGITSPLGMDAAIVTADETHNGNKTWYQHDGYMWCYKGSYNKRETQSFFSASGVRSVILKTTDNLELDFEYVVGNDELDAYFDGVLFTQHISEVGDIGFTSNLIKFTVDVPISTDINVRRLVPNIDDEPRTNDDAYVNAFKKNYEAIAAYMKTQYKPKGVAMYGYNTITGPILNIDIPPNEAIPIVKHELFKNTNNVEYVSDTTFKLKAGELYRLEFDGVLCITPPNVTSADIVIGLKNVSDNTVVTSGKNYYIGTDFNSVNDGWGRGGSMCFLLEPEHDTVYALINMSPDTTSPKSIIGLYTATALVITEL